jgi:thioredoxin 1
MAFRDGVLVFSQPGALPAAGLEQVIKAVRDLDMDDVRAQMAHDHHDHDGHDHHGHHH